jgi:hypothetical protein
MSAGFRLSKHAPLVSVAGNPWRIRHRSHRAPLKKSCVKGLGRVWAKSLRYTSANLGLRLIEGLSRHPSAIGGSLREWAHQGTLSKP